MQTALASRSFLAGARAAILAIVLAAGAGTVFAGVPWIKDDADTAYIEAKQKNRPLLLYFHTTWCSWCSELESKVFSNDDVAYEANGFVALEVNGDRRAGQPLLRRFNVTTFPTVLVVTAKNEVLGRLAMYVPPADFIRFLRESTEPGESLAAVDKRIEDGDRTVEILLRSAGRHYEAGDFDVAARRYEDAVAAAQPPAPLGADAHLGVARIKMMKGDTAGALEQYRKVLRSYPDSKRLAEAFVSALFILRQNGGTQEIDALYREFAGKFPDDPAVLNDHARHLLETGGDVSLAVEKATRAASLSPQSPDYEATHARALLAAKRPQEAMEAATKALTMRPTDKDLWLLRLEVMDAVREATAPPKPDAGKRSAPASSAAPAPSTAPAKP